MGTDLRNEQIYRLKKQGTPVRRIASRYGISARRVREICALVREQKGQAVQSAQPESVARALSTPTRRALERYWGNSDIVNTPEIIVKLGAVGISHVKRIGPKSLQEIAAVLERFGCIADASHWLSREDKKSDEPGEEGRKEETILTSC